MSSLLKTLLTIGLGLAPLGAGLWFYAHTPESILIESEESKNAEMAPVYNEIKWIPGENQDVWMMNQSHFGRHPSKQRWERLAIVIDKTTVPKTARFYQLTPGPLEWREDLIQQRVSYRVSCFICHNNGPRAIRPQISSTLAPLNWRDQLKLSLWNLRIKSYGRIHYDKIHDSEDASLSVGFRFHGKPHDDLLKVPLCQKCHREDGWFARGPLHRQQIGTIQHLVEKGQMPPPGFQLSADDKKHLQDFIRGFH